ncbi:hypothetical protein RRG08_058849 [Elysia crispata]|uniref:Uncharacterized protein n=1 Tax=Elysia crispata TaxID=231223 RepID=A0AAE0XZK1_9GAST|nr:hypothetical protein RRG08_058849 [Elysia crispata]
MDRIQGEKKSEKFKRVNTITMAMILTCYFLAVKCILSAINASDVAMTLASQRILNQNRNTCRWSGDAT